MGKRNRKRIRPHEIPDDDMVTVEKPEPMTWTQRDAPIPIRPPRQKVFQPKGDLPYVEGDVVRLRQVTGTVAFAVGQEYFVLDAVGVIHRGYVSEVTLIQS